MREAIVLLAVEDCVVVKTVDDSIAAVEVGLKLRAAAESESQTSVQEEGCSAGSMGRQRYRLLRGRSYGAQADV